MRKLLSSLCASVLAVSFSIPGAASLNAAPIAPSNPVSATGGQFSDVQYVRDNWRRGGWNHGGGGRWAGRGPWGGTDMPAYNRGGGRYDGWRGNGWRGNGWRGDRYWRGGGGRNWAYYNGYRGYRNYRPGYRYYNDYWFPGAAFVAGAIISGAIANSGPRYYGGGGSSHVEWCYNRYRSYRASDNTFQPYNGPRRQCVSPY